MDNENHILDVHTASNGNYGDLLMTQRSQKSSLCQTLSMQMKGNEVFKIAVNTLSNDVVEILAKNNILAQEIDLFIPHQANLRIIKAVQEKLNLSDEKCVITVQNMAILQLLLYLWQ